MCTFKLKSKIDLIDGTRMWQFGSVGDVVGRINEVNQRRAPLVLGWVTVCRRVNHLGK